MIVVGLVGRKGSGKSTAANVLVDRRGFVRIPFAKPIKDMLRALGLQDVHLDGSLKEAPNRLLGGRTPRHAMQTLGTEWGRTLIHPDLWVMAWTAAVRRLPWKTPGVVADDLRFENEAIAVRRMQGHIVRIVRADAGAADAHASEAGTGAIGVDFEIRNDGTPDDLHMEIERMIRR